MADKTVFIIVIVFVAIVFLSQQCTNSQVQDAQKNEEIAKAKYETLQQTCAEEMNNLKLQLEQTQSTFLECVNEREEWHVKYIELKSKNQNTGIFIIIYDVLIGVALIFLTKPLEQVSKNTYYSVIIGIFIIGLLIALYIFGILKF